MSLPDVVVEDLRAIAGATKHRGVIWLSAAFVAMITAWNVPWIRMFELPIMQGPVVSLALFGAGLLSLVSGMRLTRLARWKGLAVLGLSLIVFAVHVVMSPAPGGLIRALTPDWAVGAICILGGAMVALPVLMASLWTLRFARLPNALSAALIGTGSGMFGMGVLHYWSPYQETVTHLVLHHGGSAVVVLLLTLLAAMFTSRRTLRRSRVSAP
jgi:hypothetical protein